MIQVSTRNRHVNQGGSTPATWVVEAPPTPSCACTCLGEPRVLPAGPEHSEKPHQSPTSSYSRYPVEKGGNWEGQALRSRM